MKEEIKEGIKNYFSEIAGGKMQNTEGVEIIVGARTDSAMVGTNKEYGRLDTISDNIADSILREITKGDIPEDYEDGYCVFHKIADVIFAMKEKDISPYEAQHLLFRLYKKGSLYWTEGIRKSQERYGNIEKKRTLEARYPNEV